MMYGMRILLLSDFLQSHLERRPDKNKKHINYFIFLRHQFHSGDGR